MNTENNMKNAAQLTPLAYADTGFNRIVDPDGSVAYHWIDTNIEHLSSTKLWSVLRLAKLPGCEIDPCFAQQITRELTLRNHFDETQPWHKPH